MEIVKISFLALQLCKKKKPENSFQFKANPQIICYGKILQNFVLSTYLVPNLKTAEMIFYGLRKTHQVNFVLIFYCFNDESGKKGKQTRNLYIKINSGLNITRS